MKPTQNGVKEGFSLVEVLVAVTLFGVATMSLAGAAALGLSQMGKARQDLQYSAAVQQVTDSLVGAGWNNVTNGSATVGVSPLAAMGVNSIAIRATRGIGTVCAKHATLARYGLWKTGGSILATADDSALVYQISRDNWQALKITAVGTPAAMGVPACAWPGARPPDIVVEFA